MAEVQEESEPRSLQEAQMGGEWDKWKSAIQEELDSHAENGTWEISRLPKGRKAIGCKWVFKIKRGSDGEILKYKARLVAKGYSQIEGVDFTDTFAPVASIGSIRTLLAYGNAMGWDIHQMDVKTAFYMEKYRKNYTCSCHLE
ncbi:hypothetical protein L7F22_032709 [Adiantum nelumboides]|nr:hypothetical protein [Adiantum nelumboides]